MVEITPRTDLTFVRYWAKLRPRKPPSIPHPEVLPDKSKNG